MHIGDASAVIPFAPMTEENELLTSARIAISARIDPERRADAEAYFFGEGTPARAAFLETIIASFPNAEEDRSYWRACRDNMQISIEGHLQERASKYAYFKQIHRDTSVFNPEADMWYWLLLYGPEIFDRHHSFRLPRAEITERARCKANFVASVMHSFIGTDDPSSTAEKIFNYFLPSQLKDPGKDYIREGRASTTHIVLQDIAYVMAEALHNNNLDRFKALYRATQEMVDQYQTAERHRLSRVDRRGLRPPRTSLWLIVQRSCTQGNVYSALQGTARNERIATRVRNLTVDPADVRAAEAADTTLADRYFSLLPASLKGEDGSKASQLMKAVADELARMTALNEPTADKKVQEIVMVLQQATIGLVLDTKDKPTNTWGLLNALLEPSGTLYAALAEHRESGGMIMATLFSCFADWRPTGLRNIISTLESLRLETDRPAPPPPKGGRDPVSGMYYPPTWSKASTPEPERDLPRAAATGRDEEPGNTI